MRAPLLLALCLPLAAQRPEGLRKDFFARDLKTVAVEAADKSRVQRVPDAMLLAACGRIYLKAGERERAEDAFRRALEEGDPEARLAVGAAWLEAGHPEKALPVLAVMAVKGRRSAEAASKAAGLLLIHGKLAEATALQDKALTASPKDWSLCVGYGAAALNAGQRELATVWFEKAVALQPTGDEVWIALAKACAENAK